MATRRAGSARAAVDHSFEELYRGHRSDVYRAVLRDLGNPHDAEDVTQAAFLDAYRAVLRGSQPQSPRAWLLAIAENVRRRRFRTSQRRPREEPLDADFPVTAELSHELAHGLAAALAELPDEQRQVFLLREFGGLSYDEIADRLDATVGSIQMLLFRARRSLREQLEPPTVSRRRTGLFVPLPGWLATIASRLEVVGLAPRAAGAVGAAVLTVVGASVAVSGPEAATPAPAIAPAPTFATPVTRASGSPSARAIRRMRVSGPSLASRAAPFPARAGTPAAKRSAPVAADDAQVTANAPATAAPSASPSSRPSPASAGPVVPVAPPAPVPVIPALERPPISVPLPLPEPERPLELPVPPPSPVLPIDPPPVDPPPIDLAPGAAGAAGAGAPPLPVPALPPIPLPPA